MNPSQEDLRILISALRKFMPAAVMLALTRSCMIGSPTWGLQLDLLDDSVGMMIILFAMIPLAKLRVHDRYRRTMKAVQIAYWLKLLLTLKAHVLYPWPSPFEYLCSGMEIAVAIGTVCFCVAMRWLANEHGLARASASWKTSGLLMAVSAVLTTGVQLWFPLPWPILGSSANAGVTGFIFFPIICFICIADIHLLISIIRTYREAEPHLDTSEPAKASGEICPA